jgi:hypothetical protein
VTIIEIRRFRNGWECFEAPGVKPVCLDQEQPIATTAKLLRLASGAEARRRRLKLTIPANGNASHRVENGSGTLGPKPSTDSSKLDALSTEEMRLPFQETSK